MPRRKEGRYVKAQEGFTLPDGIHVAAGDLASPDHPIVKKTEWAWKEVHAEDYVRFLVEPKKADRVVEATKEPGKKRGS